MSDHKEKSNNNRGIPAPVALKTAALAAVAGRNPLNALTRSGSGADLTGMAKRAKLVSKLGGSSRTPDPINMQASLEEGDGLDRLLSDRLLRYALDYPEDYEEYKRCLVDKESKWVSRSKAVPFRLAEQLPYSTESHTDQARYLTHVIVHLYIAIKSLDLEGYVCISTKDLAAVKNDIDELTLDTDFFNADISFDLDEEEDGDEEDEVKSSGVVGKVLPRSAAIVSVNHWTNELSSCLKMKFELPLTLRASLAKVYYYLSLSRGQSIKLSSYSGMFMMLTDSFVRDLSECGALELDHKCMLEFFQQFYPDPDPKFDIYHPGSNDSDKKAFSSMQKLAARAANFFPKTAMKEVFDWTMQRFHPTTCHISLPILAAAFPVYFAEDESAMEFINTIFHIWTNFTSHKVRSEPSLFQLLSKISTKAYLSISKNELTYHQLHRFGILTDVQLEFVLNRIQNNLRSDFRDQSYSQVASLLVSSITPMNFKEFSAKLETLLNSLQTFVHPSNPGPWSGLIAKFCQRFINAYHKRLKQEEKEECELADEFKLSVEMNEKIANIFQDLVLLGAQGKKENVSAYYISSIGYLVDIPYPSKHTFIDKILLDLYDSLTDQFVNSTHRIIVSLKQFTEISRFIVYDPIYRVHITQILLLLVDKIGTNDLNLTNHVLNCFVTLSSVIPYREVVTDDDFLSFESTNLTFLQEHLEFLKIIINNAFKASTMGFRELIKLFTEKLYLLIDTDLSEKFNFKITQVVLIFTESLSDDLFHYMAGIVHEKLLEGDFRHTVNNSPIIANMSAAMIRRDPSLAPKVFKDIYGLIKLELDNGAGSNRTRDEVPESDKKLELFLIVISEVISVSNEHMLEFSDAVLDLFSLLYEKVSNPSLATTTAYVIHKTLKNLTNIKLKESRILKHEPTVEQYAESWGANQFSDTRFEEQNLEFEWYVPTHKSIHCAIDIFETVVMKSLASIEHICSQAGEPDLLAIDELIKNLSYVGTALSGSSILFDPDFNNAVEDEKCGSTSIEKKLKILRSLRAKKSDTNEINIDIEQITKEEDPEILPESKEISDTDAPPQDPTEIQSDEHSAIQTDEEGATSRLLTPSYEFENDLTAVMNTSLAFRSANIYGCDYFFGDKAAQKKASFGYNHVHSLRHLIAQCLHKVFLYLSSHKNENTNLFYAYTSTVRTYFSDVGKEFSYDLDDQIFIDYTFLKKVQSMGNYVKPFTRTCLAARAEKFHRQRVILHSTNRFPSKIDKILLNDLMQLVTSSFETTSAAAYPVVIQTMKKIIGSYSMILKSLLDQMDEFLLKDDEKRLESGLKMFLYGKFSSKISGDFQNVERVVSLISKCSNVEHQNVNSLAKNLMVMFAETIKVPSGVALFNEAEIDLSIRPPDKCIDLEISAVRSAKDKKRHEYIVKLEELQVLLLSLVKQNCHWKHKFGLINYLINLQDYYELRTTPDVLKQLVLDPNSSHPALVKHCITWFSKMVDKVMNFASYEYSLEKSFQLNYLRPGMMIIDTTNNFHEEFSQEMQNFKNPKFYVDGPFYRGWLFWGENLVALSPVKSFDYIKLSDDDRDTLTQFGALVDKKWLASILRSVTVDNESKAVFQASDVYLISAVVQLSELGFTVVSYQDILDLLDEIYNREDKASIILAAEIVCGLFVSTNHTTEANIALRDDKLDTFLDKVFSSDLTPEYSGIWSIISWWLPSKLDFRRMPVFHKKMLSLSKIIDPESDHALTQSSRLKLARVYFQHIDWQLQNIEPIVDSLNFEHPYKVVRTQIGGLFSSLSHSCMYESYANCAQFLDAQNTLDLGVSNFRLTNFFDKRLKAWFAKAEDSRTAVEAMTAQDAMHSEYYYLCSSISGWLVGAKMSFFYNELVPYIKDYIFPMLMKLDSYRDLCKLAQISLDAFFVEFANGLDYRPEDIPGVISLANEPYSSFHQLCYQLSFIEGLFSRELILLSSEQKYELIARVDTLLFNNSIEVRTKAATVLTGIIHNSLNLAIVDQFIEKYKKRLLKRVKRDNLSPEKMVKIHGAVIGLGALISAFPYTSPPPKWMPDQIVLLARASSYPGIIGKSAKDILSQFKKLRADTWHIDRQSFTEDQLEDLEGVLWRSYFA
ncbi:Proteasome activator BLM10 AltName: Full=Bleomycin resistance protein BLM10 [Cyberlindnera jadinii]|uniref:Uncharacterized protein n=1 Tax=Cyberlindnera jadinii (strain ATCC 18201 / CBS 1600 / BCRC 20928 / JCM 3617 / NBRC 0987 / NRRL Y-1542) TaxID=983966 RepID=A0A0H5C8C2_CYBJN|nr:Proteasome activator BLM10 AltName: Full=Bleomycin resistance protein BLM10 [Cyberlindnera jadinii]